MAWLFLRRSASLIALPALIVLGIVLAHSRTGWEGEWQVAVSTATGVSLVLSPAVAGLAAFDTVRFVSRDAEELLRPSPRLGRFAVVLAWPAAVCGMAAVTVTVLVAMVRALMAGTPVFGLPWILLLGVTGVAAASGVGVLAGVLLRNIAAAPIVAVALYALEIQLDNRLGTFVFGEGGATSSLAGLRLDGAGCAAVLALQLGLATSCLVLARVRLGSRRPVAPRAVAAGGGAVALVVVGGGYASAHWDTVPWQRTSVRYVCAGDAPRVCVAVQNAQFLDATASAMEGGAARLTAVGAVVPSTFRQETRADVDASSWKENEGVLTFDVTWLENGGIPEFAVAQSLSRPRMCPQYFADDPPRELLDVESRVQRWLEQSMGLDPGYVEGSPVPGDEEIAELYDVLLACGTGTAPSGAASPGTDGVVPADQSP